MHLSRSRSEYPQMNNMDPLQTHELILEQKIFLPLSEPDHLQTIRPLIFKVMKAKNQERLIIYILSEADLYFLYKIDVPTQKMYELNDQYGLHLKRLSQLVDLLKTSLEEIQNQEKIGTVEIVKDYNKLIAIWQIKKIVGGKSHMVLRLQGQRESQEMIIDHVAFVYGSMRQRIMEKEQKIDQLKELVRLKNPYLLKHFKPA